MLDAAAETPIINALTIQPVAYTYTISKSDPRWVTVTHEHFSENGSVIYQASLCVYDTPSHYGFLGGRISKLEIKLLGDETGETGFYYDRGDFAGYLDEPGRLLLKALVDKFN
jgi:hypothetical protein